MDIGFIILLVVIAAQMVVFCIKKWDKNLFKKISPDISEPVISFVELVKNNPDRFRLNLDRDEVIEYMREHGNNLYDFYVMWDKKDKEYFSLQVFCEETHFITQIDYSYLTADECNYIYQQLKPIFHARKDKLELIKSQRKVRNDQRKRQRDIKKYCKEGV